MNYKEAVIAAVKYGETVPVLVNGKRVKISVAEKPKASAGQVSRLVGSSAVRCVELGIVLQTSVFSGAIGFVVFMRFFISLSQTAVENQNAKALPNASFHFFLGKSDICEQYQFNKQ